MKTQIYTVPLIAPDLRREETIIHIADTLDHLEKITENIFQKISVRVNDYRKRLQSINERAENAQAKINRIKGSSKATMVFSSYKYPGLDQLEDYRTVFTSQNGFDLEDLKRSNQRIKSKHPTLDERVLKEKLQFYNVRSSEQKGDDLEGTEEGLGRLPNALDSVGTLLLFNTAENPYKKYVMLDPLGAVTKTRKSLEDGDETDIASAPFTITHKEQLEKMEKENYFYSPGLGIVPEMDVPLALPDLPGIADDMLYIADSEPSIAPSLPTMHLPDLPSLVPEIVSPSINDMLLPPSAPPPPPSELPSSPPPPPPPLPSDLSPPPLTDSTDSAAKLPPVSRSEVANRRVPEASGAPVANPEGARANLLESIRQAGGSAKLKSVEDRKIEAKKKLQEEKTAVKSTGDLMSDLVHQLMIRRKGISGTSKAAAGSPSSQAPPVPSAVSIVSAMDRVSALIPPPEKADEDEREDDEDWD